MAEMELFYKFLQDLKEHAKDKIQISDIQKSISKINRFFYQTYPELGTTKELDDEEFPYFSEFHKFWKEHHKEILNPQIDTTQCEFVADVLHNVFIKYNKRPFYELYNIFSLNPKEICLIRYFSANQDFRGTRDFEDLFEKYRDDPSIFGSSGNLVGNNPQFFYG